MQRDMKVGLAVGVALIGIVGALFFRREPDVRHAEAPPPMKDTREIDRLIGEKGKAPYMEGIEEFSDRAPVPPPLNPAAKSKAGTDGDDAPKFGRSDDGRNRERNSPNAVPAPVPGELTDNPIYAHNRDWEPDGAASPGGKKGAESERPGAAGSTNNPPRTHVIQAGETLSGLAARYLGSSARFREIYEANRNVLRSPDDLRDGVTIVIPDAGRPRDQQHVSGNGGALSSSGNAVKAQSASARSADADKDASSAAKASPGDAPREKIRFAPVKGGPFAAGRVAPQTNSTKADGAKSDDSN